MKSFLALVLAALSVITFAATPNIHRPHRRISTPRKTEIVVPWKTVAAGGAAAGTIIAAYKVSDGVEEGIKTVAKEKPEVFTDSLSVLTWPVRWGILGLFLLVYYWIWRVLIRRLPTSTPKG
jgi:hypothetical protein